MDPKMEPKWDRLPARFGVIWGSVFEAKIVTKNDNNLEALLNSILNLFGSQTC
jgi:hypothetical protein